MLLNPYPAEDQVTGSYRAWKPSPRWRLWQLPWWPLLVHCTPHRAFLLLGISRLLISCILYPFKNMYWVLSIWPVPPQGWSQDTHVGRDCVSYLFMFPQHPTEREPGTQKILRKKKFAINNIITVMGIIISGHSLATAQREAGEGMRGLRMGKTSAPAALEATPRGPVLQGSP